MHVWLCMFRDVPNLPKVNLFSLLYACVAVYAQGCPQLTSGTIFFTLGFRLSYAAVKNTDPQLPLSCITKPAKGKHPRSLSFGQESRPTAATCRFGFRDFWPCFSQEFQFAAE